jgi:signal transduction histidine kinase/CheY-like chemotaxis protein
MTGEGAAMTQTLRERADRDLARSGGVLALLVYPLLAFLSGLASELGSDHPWLVAAEVATLASVGFVRHRLGLKLSRGPAEQLSSARRHYTWAILATALVWSGFAAMVVHFYGRSWTGLLILLLTLGIVAASTANLTPDFRLLRVYVIIMMVPASAAMAAHGQLPEIVTALVLLLFCGFMISIGQRHFLRYRELSQAMLDLEEARHAADQSNRAKSRFLATMSHEIRTPMNAIVGLSELLMEQGEGRQEWLRGLRDSSQALLGLLTDILDLSKIEAGYMRTETEPLGLAHLLQDLLHSQQSLAGAKGLQLRLEKEPGLPAACRTDGQRLRQILLNLLSNAIKFSESGSVVLKLKQAGSELEFSVWDEGCGISPGDFPRLFRPFSQLDGSDSRPHGGTGLGLAISAELARLLGGRLWLSSRGHWCGETPDDWVCPQQPRGSQFWLRLPLQAAEAPVEPAVLSNQSRSLHILVAEDNRINQMVIAETLTRLGHSVKLVASGRAALQALEEEAYQVVLMDVQMPEMDGLETTRRIRQKNQPGPWIIALTANAMVEDRERCLQAGMNDFLSKPVCREALIEALARA